MAEQLPSRLPNSENSASILVLDDNPDVLLAAEIVLKAEFPSVQIESDPKKLPGLLEQNEFDVVLLDMNYSTGATSGQEGIQLLETVRSTSPHSKVILMTAYAGVELAIKVIKQGATDFVMKPWDNAKLLATVSAAIRHSQSDRQLRQLEVQKRELVQFTSGDSVHIVGESESLKQVLKQISKVAATDANVLILGENGTGKELVARAIHQQSLRSDQAFIDVDIGAINESLFESELFGHTKGAFTDAKHERAGRFEMAADGTLFLDEIGNLSTQMQAKLLGALQSMSVSRVGADTPIQIDARLICATNTPLYTMVDNERFRQDLLYRINTVEIRLPSLRERISDVPILANHFMQIYTRKYQKHSMRFAAPTLAKLKKYDWPGNIRELQHAVERAVIMAEGSSLQPADFLLKATVSKPSASNSLNLEEVERITIKNAILKHNGNISQAAGELGLARASLYRKIAKYGI